MDTQKIIQELEQERDRLTAAIDALRDGLGSSSVRGRKSGAALQSTRARAARRGGITPAGRKRLSEMMKKRWQERRKSQTKKK